MHLLHHLASIRNLLASAARNKAGRRGQRLRHLRGRPFRAVRMSLLVRNLQRDHIRVAAIRVAAQTAAGLTAATGTGTAQRHLLLGPLQDGR